MKLYLLYAFIGLLQAAVPSSDEEWSMTDFFPKNDPVQPTRPRPSVQAVAQSPYDESPTIPKNQAPLPGPFNNATHCTPNELKAIVKGNNPDLCVARFESCISNPPLHADAGDPPKGSPPGTLPADLRDVYEQYKLSDTRRTKVCAKIPRYFILAIGPPASGKGTVIERLIYPALHMSKDNKKHPLINVDVDHFSMLQRDVDVFKKLKQEIKIVDSHAPTDGKLSKKVKAALNSLGSEGFTHYNMARYRFGDMHANYPMYEMFTCAQGNPCARKHVIYETTLSSPGSLQWSIRVARQAKQAGLTPVVVYPFTFRKKLYRQAMKRGAYSGRLPSPSQVKGMAPAAMRWAMAIARHMLTSPDSDFSRFFLVDNTGTPDTAHILRTIRAPHFNKPALN